MAQKWDFRYLCTRYWLPERVLRTVLIISIAVVVMVVENRARNDDNDTRRVTVTTNLFVTSLREGSISNGYSVTV